MIAKNLILFVQCLIGYRLTCAQYPRSPCPDIFAYHYDPTSQNVFGYVTLRGLQPGQNSRLDVILSIGALVTQNVGSIKLVKSTDETYKDIENGRPAQYWVVFPVQNPLPLVVSVIRNGQTICTGQHAQSLSRTTTSLHYTIYPPPIIHPLSYSYEPVVVNNFRYSSDLYREPDFGRSYDTERFKTHVPITSTTTTTTQRSITPSRWKASSKTVDLNDICGKPQNRLLNKLSINGHRTEKDQFPWIVPLFDRHGSRDPKYVCGSSLVSQKHLITAAHCVFNKDADKILAIPGLYNIEDFFDPNAVLADIKNVTIHEDYSEPDAGQTQDADLAILLLKNELVFSKHIMPICLWRGSNDLTELINHKGLMAGWGITETGPTEIPYHVTTRVVSKQECRKNLDGVTIDNRDRIFCGDGDGSVPCNGDSGSGLMMERDNRYFLRGVVSTGVSDTKTLKCDVTKFVIYTDVAQFRYWIKLKMM